MNDELLAVALEHHELADRAVEVPGVMRKLLVIELQLPGVGVEGDDGRGEEVVAWTWAGGLPVGARPVVERRRVAGAPPHRVGLWIVATRHPAAAASRLPGLAAPRLHGLLGAGDREELPHLAPAGGVDAEDRTASRPLAALGADDDLVLHEQRRAREADGELLRVDELGVPRRLAGLHVERDEPPVDGAHEHLALPEGDPTRVWRVRLRCDEVVVQLREVGPEWLAAGRVERPHAAVGAGVVEHAVGDERRRLQAARRAAGMVHPRHSQPFDVVGVDLGERAVVPGAIGAVIRGPVVAAGVGHRCARGAARGLRCRHRARPCDEHHQCKAGQVQYRSLRCHAVIASFGVSRPRDPRHLTVDGPRRADPLAGLELLEPNDVGGGVKDAHTPAVLLGVDNAADSVDAPGDAGDVQRRG